MAAILLVAAAHGATAQGCVPPEKTGQCNELGSIIMDFTREVDGQPVEITTSIAIHRLYREQEVRAFLFSVRNVSADGGASPVSLSLVRFATAAGDVAITKREDRGTHEINLWVDVLDVPIGKPIELTVHVGVREKGAYRLEALVMPFDRGYAPVYMTDGTQANLFAFTLLAVHQPTAPGGPAGGVFGGQSVGKKLPGLEPVALAAAAVAAAVLAGRMGRRP